MNFWNYNTKYAISTYTFLTCKGEYLLTVICLLRDNPWEGEVERRLAEMILVFLWEKYFKWKEAKLKSLFFQPRLAKKQKSQTTIKAEQKDNHEMALRVLSRRPRSSQISSYSFVPFLAFRISCENLWSLHVIRKDYQADALVRMAILTQLMYMSHHTPWKLVPQTGEVRCKFCKRFCPCDWITKLFYGDSRNFHPFFFFFF